MMTSSAHRRAFAWAGLVLGPLAWAAHHQLGGDLNFWDCHRGHGAALAAFGAAMLALAAVGGAMSFVTFRGRRDDNAGEAPTTRFIAALGAMSGGLFSLTLLFQIAAALLIPACFR